METSSDQNRVGNKIVKLSLHCYSCNLKEIRQTSEIIDNDIILCNHCGSEAVEFVEVDAKPMVHIDSKEERELRGK